MSYYKVKKVSVSKNGNIKVTAADSSLRPLSFFTSEYHGTLAEFLQSADEGNFQLYRGANPLIEDALDRISRVGRAIATHDGLDLHTQYNYEMKDVNDMIRQICEREAYILLKQKGMEPEYVAKPNVDALILKAQKNLETKKEEERNKGIIRIWTAAVSIFKGYDLLKPVDGSGWILAPEQYYVPGKLSCPPDRIIPLGEDADGLYSFLSFSGISFTREEYKEKIDRNGMDLFDRAALVVSRVLEKGLELNAEPYKGYLDEIKENAA